VVEKKLQEPAKIVESLQQLSKELWLKRGDPKVDEIAMKINSCLYDSYPSSGTRPPFKYAICKFHWLHAERASYPSIAQWEDGLWHTVYELAITPVEMEKRGWHWYAAARPPLCPSASATFEHFPEFED